MTKKDYLNFRIQLVLKYIRQYGNIVPCCFWKHSHPNHELDEVGQVPMEEAG